MAERRELEYLGQLIRDFPPAVPITSTEALRKLVAGFAALELTVPGYVDDLVGTSSPYPEWFHRTCRDIHRFLFNGITGNAGEFRSSADPNDGFVAFGSDRWRYAAGSKYRGAAPRDIPTHLRHAMSFLSPVDEDPVGTAIRFYEEFVRIHPFYDANGRIGRLLVTIYLQRFEYYVRWRELEAGRKNEFLKKLNACHDRVNQPSFERYFGYLDSFWRRFVKARDDLEPSDLGRGVEA